jgi:S1-C subfamily serine protease
LIGMNTSIVSPSGGSAGIGFAVPVDTIARVVPELIKHGRELRPTIGVELAEDAVARRLGLVGALILNIVPDSPAAQAKLHPTQQDERSGRIALGDVIMGVDSAVIQSTADLYLALETHKAGDKVKLTLNRAGQPAEAEVELTVVTP